MLFTIGYEGASPEEFIATLRGVGISRLVDIRDRPQSRRPGFSKNALSQSLEAVGIRYIHLGELGDPKEGRNAARAGNYGVFRDIYARVLESSEAQSAVEKLVEWASREDICLLCYERNPQECHRQLVSRAVESHINDRTTHLGVRPSNEVSSAVGRMRHTRESAAPPQ